MPLITILQKSGFCDKWRNWIENYTSTPSLLSILVNGVPGEKFNVSRGTRQGDLLSSYLFILSAELLARELSQAS